MCWHCVTPFGVPQGVPPGRGVLAGGVDQEGFDEADRVHGNPFVYGLGSIAFGRPLRRLETVEVRLDLLHWHASLGLLNENDVIRHGAAWLSVTTTVSAALFDRDGSSWLL